MKVGIDLGGSHIAIGVVDKNGKILELWYQKNISVINLFLPCFFRIKHQSI